MFQEATAQFNTSLFTGIHVSSFESSQNLITTHPLTNLTGGVALSYDLDEKLAVSTGLIFTKKGFSINQSTSFNVLGIDLPVGAKAETSVNYLEVPLLLQLKLTDRLKVKPYVAGGPVIAYATSGHIRTKATAIIDFNIAETPLQLDSPDYNRTQILGQIKGGIAWPYGDLGHFITEVIYSHSFTDLISENYAVDIGGRHKGWTLNVGYGMRF